MEKEFVNYNQALKLKALGFNEPCLGGYIRFRGSGSFELAFYKYRNVDFNTTSNIYVSAPLYQQAFRWFREKYRLGHMINGIGYESFIMNIGGVLHIFNAFDFETYEEAELACLDKLIEIVESKSE